MTKPANTQGLASRNRSLVLTLIMLVYIDDIAIAGSSIHVIDRIKDVFKNR